MTLVGRSLISIVLVTNVNILRDFNLFDYFNLFYKIITEKQEDEETAYDEEDIDGIPLDLDAYNASLEINEDPTVDPSNDQSDKEQKTSDKVTSESGNKKKSSRDSLGIKFELKPIEEKKLNKIMIGPMMRKKSSGSGGIKSIVPKMISDSSKQEGNVIYKKYILKKLK